MGGFGRILERYVRMAISALEFFAKEDTHAMQYSFIGKSLLSSAQQYLETKEAQERLCISENSSQLFGLIPREDPNPKVASAPVGAPTNVGVSAVGIGEAGRPSLSTSHIVDSPFADIDSSIFPLYDPLTATPGFSQLAEHSQDQADHVFGALNLFPLLENNGHIDLAHYL